MRAILQRVRHASVRVDEELVGQIGPGLLVLLGVTPERHRPASPLASSRTRS